MNIIMDGGPSIEFGGQTIKVSEDTGDDIGPLDVVFTFTGVGVIIDIVDLDSGDVISTESETWDEIAARLSTR